MENIFNVNDYFTVNFGLGDKPKVHKMSTPMLVSGIFIIITSIVLGIVVNKGIISIAIPGAVLFAIPIIKNCIAKSKANEWQNNYNERYQKWDAELDKFYAKTVEEMNIKQAAMKKINLDESDKTLTEVTPIDFAAQIYDGWYRFGADGEIRTDDREITYIFFSREQIYLYKVFFSLTGRDQKIENTREFFYSDIVSISTNSVIKTLNTKKAASTVKNETIESEEFTLVVPGDRITCSVPPNYSNKKSPIQGMKTQIRAKKNGNKDEQKNSNRD